MTFDPPVKSGSPPPFPVPARRCASIRSSFRGEAGKHGRRPGNLRCLQPQYGAAFFPRSLPPGRRPQGLGDI